MTKQIIRVGLSKAANIFIGVLDQIKTRIHGEVLLVGKDKGLVASGNCSNDIEEGNIADSLLPQYLFYWARNTRQKSQCLNIISTPVVMEHHDIMQDLLSKYNKKHAV